MKPDDTYEVLSTEVREISTGSLYVNVDYNDLAASVGHDEALKILNELRALLT